MAPSAQQRPVLAAPPRQVSTAVAINVALGGTRSRAGWLLLLLGMIPVWAVTARSEAVSALDLAGPRGRVPGTVTAVTETFFAEEPHEGRTYLVTYRYAVGATELEGASYGPRPAGAAVTVEHRLDAPQVSRIVGLRRQPYGAEAALLLLLPLAGLGLAAREAARAPRRLALLRHGIAVAGRVLEARDAGSVARRRLSELTVAYSVPRRGLHGSPFRGAAGEEERQITVTIPWTPPPTEQTVAHEIPLLLDPDRPERAVSVLSLPGLLAIEPDGTLTTCRSSHLSILLPLATLLLHALVGLVVFVT